MVRSGTIARRGLSRMTRIKSGRRRHGGHEKYRRHRRRHHRRWAQRPHVRGLPRQGGAQGGGARAEPRCRRGGGDGGIPPRFSQLGRRLHGQPAQSESDRRPRTRQGGIADRRAAGCKLLAGRRQSLSADARRSRGTAGGHRAILGARRRAAAAIRRDAGACGRRVARSRADDATQRRRRHRRVDPRRHAGTAHGTPRRR